LTTANSGTTTTSSSTTTGGTTATTTTTTTTTGTTTTNGTTSSTHSSSTSTSSHSTSGTTGTTHSSTTGTQGTSSATTTTTTTTTTTSSTGSTGFTPGPHQPWPQVPANSGQVLAHPELFVISYVNDSDGNPYPFSDTVEQMGQYIVTSSWLTAVGSEYGVGPGSYAGSVRLTDVPPTSVSDSDTHTLIQNLIQSGQAPAPDGQNIYMVYYPSTTQVSDFNGDLGCQMIGGYHGEAQITVNGSPQTIIYAVLPDCPQPTDNLNEVQSIEASTSHEFIEASTDPYVFTNMAYQLTDGNNPWSSRGGELADLCAFNHYAVPGTSFVFQRSWSNQTALTDSSPCVPDPSTVFLGVSVQPVQVVSGRAGTVTNLTVQAWSTASHAAWTVYANTVGGDVDPMPTVTPTQLSNGQSGTLALTLPSTAQSGQQGVVWVYASQGATNDSQWWPVVINVQ
jgi:hypothetical protein